MSFQLSSKAVRLGLDVPSEDTILALGRDLLDSTKSWTEGKKYAKGKVLTLHQPKRPGDEASWYCRVSEHGPDDATFDEFWSKLGVKKAENEKQFISVIKRAIQVQQMSATQSVWTMYYTYPFPVSSRIFTVLHTTHLEDAPRRSGMIVSIPIDLSGEDLPKIKENGIQGRYVAVEQILELDHSKVEWRMATSGTPGGLIPSFIVESSMPGQIAADVTHFLKWFHTIRDQPNATA